MNDSRAVLMAPSVVGDPSQYEKDHVHAVYDEIASHFSSTRYKPWPIVSSFISSLLPGSVGLDLGCGNGKYLNLPSDNPSRIRIIGLDRSLNLLKLARNAGTDSKEVVFGDALQIPWRRGIFDFVISIATIHHLATHTRRVQAVQTTLRLITSHGGRILIYVWAKEQDDQSKRIIPTDSRSEAKGDECNTPSVSAGVDVFVPWVYSRNQPKGQTSEPPEEMKKPEVYHRYYHMFADGELRRLVDEAAQGLGMDIGDQSKYKGKGLTIVQEGWERSNYYVELLSWQNT